VRRTRWRAPNGQAAPAPIIVREFNHAKVLEARYRKHSARGPSNFDRKRLQVSPADGSFGPHAEKRPKPWKSQAICETYCGFEPAENVLELVRQVISTLDTQANLGSSQNPEKLAKQIMRRLS